jgi:hypothetical protein
MDRLPDVLLNRIAHVWHNFYILTAYNCVKAIVKQIRLYINTYL